MKTLIQHICRVRFVRYGLLLGLVAGGVALAQPIPVGGGGTTPASTCGDSGHALGWTGTVYSCQAITGGSAAAGGSTTQLQYNNAGAIDGITGATTNGTAVTLTSPILVTPALGTPASGVGTNLTALNATQLTSGTVPDARFPATLPALSGANLTALNATNLGSGAVPAARMPAFTGDATSSAGAVALTLATVNSNVGTFGDATHCAYITVNGKGLITAASQSTSCPGAGGGSYPALTTSSAELVITGSGTSAMTIDTVLAYVVDSTSTRAITSADNGKTIERTYTGGAIADTLPSAATFGVGGFEYCTGPIASAQNATITVTTSSIMNNGQFGSTLKVPANTCVQIADPDGTYYKVLGSSALWAGNSYIAGSTNNSVAQINGSGILTTSTALPSGLTATNMTLTTPALGTPSALVLTNATGLVASTGTTATGTPSASTFLRGDNTWATPAGAGTVTSVAQSFTGGLVSVGGSPITGSGTLALTVAGTSGGVPYFSSASTWASSAALSANALVIGGGAGAAPSTTTTGTGVLTFLGTPSSANLASALTDETGTGAAVFAGSPTFTGTITGAAATLTGTLTTNVTGGGVQCLQVNNSGVVSGTAAGCGGGGGSGTVTSVAQSFTGGLISVGGSPITTSGTLALTVAGTSGGIPYFSSSSAWASSAALTASMPVFGGGAGAAPVVGTVSGNTTKVATVSGSFTSGNGVKADANGNLVDLGFVVGPALPKYLANNFYIPVTASVVASTNPGATTATLWTPIYISAPVTISQLCTRINAGSAGNMQISIYANGAANQPTGAPLVTTANISTTSTGTVCATASLAITTPGIYWQGFQADNITATFAAISSNANSSHFLVGVNASADIWQSGTQMGVYWWTTGGTYGTWVTNPTIIEASAASSFSPVAAIKVASVP